MGVAVGVCGKEYYVRLLDLFCGAGGAAMGYRQAGFDEIVGVDIAPQPNYPFVFVQADAMEYPLDKFDFIHASPPCQAYSVAKAIHGNGDSKPDLVDAVRERLTGRRFVIENVPGAPLMRGSTMLCGQMFGLALYRHRLFESSEALFGVPQHPKHTGETLSAKSYSSFERGANVICVAGNNFKREDGAIAMGIDWMTRPELAQAVPPAYTHWIGKQVLPRL